MIDGIVVGAEIALQNGVDVDIAVDGPTGLGGGAVAAFLTTLIVGAILLAVAPEYTERLVEEVSRDPLTAFLHGFLALLVAVVIVVVLALTVIGILLVIPLAMVAYLLWAVGATVALLAIADRLVGHEDGWTKPLLVAAAVNGGLALTGIGGIISFLVGAVGFGTILGEFFD